MVASTTLTVSFAPAADGTLGLQLVEHKNVDANGFEVPTFQALDGNLSTKIRQYPADKVALVATKGEANYEGKYTEDIEKESVKFSGTSSSTKWPVDSLVSVDDIGHKYDEDGNKISDPVGFAITTDGQIEASQFFFGVVLVTYKTSYRLINYDYEITTIVGGLSGIRTVGIRIEGGTVLAINKGEIAEFETPLPKSDGEKDYTELYRVTSTSIINEEGEWEKPPGWTGEDDSPTWPGGDPDPAEPHIEKERVHRIGYTDKKGTVFPRRQLIRAADPKKFDSSYTIPKELKITEDSRLKEFGLDSSAIAKAKAQIPDPNSL